MKRVLITLLLILWVAALSAEAQPFALKAPHVFSVVDHVFRLPAASAPSSTGLLCSIYLRGAGGKGGASPSGGGGGAGGLIILTNDLGPGNYSITLWTNATAFGQTAYGGGCGGYAPTSSATSGGSGGGAGGSDADSWAYGVGGAASNGQGNAGANYTRIYWYAGSGGGGYMSAGIAASCTNFHDTVVRAGRGGGGFTNPVTGTVYCRGGDGNGFAGRTWDGGAGLDPTNQTAGLGNGGTGENDSGTGGLGSSSGLTIMYKAASAQAVGGTITTSGTWIVHEFTGYGTNQFTVGGS